MVTNKAFLFAIEILSDLKVEVDKKRPRIPRLEVESSDFQSELSDFEGVPSNGSGKNTAPKRRATPVSSFSQHFSVNI